MIQAADVNWLLVATKVAMQIQAADVKSPIHATKVAALDHLAVAKLQHQAAQLQAADAKLLILAAPLARSLFWPFSRRSKRSLLATRDAAMQVHPVVVKSLTQAVDANPHATRVAALDQPADAKLLTHATRVAAQLQAVVAKPLVHHPAIADADVVLRSSDQSCLE